MELSELRYFLAVAKHQNIHRASEDLGISPGSLSKAVAKLESELQIKLFCREGRNIRLTEQGQRLKKRATELIHLEAAVRFEVAGEKTAFHVTLAGEEVLLAHFGVALATTLQSRYPLASITLESSAQHLLMRKVRDGDVDLGLISDDPPPGFDTKPLSTAHFATFISEKHPLFQYLVAERPVPIQSVLDHTFVIPKTRLFGELREAKTTDGWRDDKFPRKIGFISSSLKTIEALVSTGQAIAYLPDYVGQQANLIQLNITGCPYTCEQHVHLITRDKREYGWINALF